MKRLTVRQVLFIQARLVAETGGSYGLRELGLLESACARPFATFDGVDLYPDLFAKAAALMHSLINNHPFVDGNKRVGVTAALLFLRMNGVEVRPEPAELVRFTLEVAKGRETVESIVRWLRSQTGA